MPKNGFDVLKKMAEKNLDIRLAPFTNMLAFKKVKRGGEVIFAVDERTIQDLIAGKGFAGGLILADLQQYEEIENEG